MKRREFLKASGSLSANVMLARILGGTLTPLSARAAEAATDLPIAALQKLLNPKTDSILLEDSPDYANANVSFNLRTEIPPEVRVIVGSAASVQATLGWAIQTKRPFALRAGGHSYEGYSQSSSIVIDVRGLNNIAVNAQSQQVTVGSGCNLGSLYRALNTYNLALPAGSCFQVGVAGHALGGGMGLLARKYGLACDNLESIELVTADGKVLPLNKTQNTDLFWACRGGGNGNFGIATQFVFNTHLVKTVCDFEIGWNEPLDSAIAVMQGWQNWLKDLPNEITGVLHITKATNGDLTLNCSGQGEMTQADVEAQLKRLDGLTGKPSNPVVTSRSFFESCLHFTTDSNGEEPVYMKGKSDYLTKPMDPAGIRMLLSGLQKFAPNQIAAICDTYGGAINAVSPSATAFVHRGTTLYAIQYYSAWGNKADNTEYLKAMTELYVSMRPYVSGGAYVNYCDLDLGAGFGQAYWGANLPRLMSIKKEYDPNNVFQHAQSIPPAK